MTESEAKGFVQGKLDCMEKCDVFNREDKHRNNECDNCEYCYSQGNFGEQKEAFQIAINALEKQIQKKVIKDQFSRECCPSCGWIVYKDEYGGRYLPHCENCGQAIDWSDEE